MTDYSTPRFWLQVRRSYVIDNFDEMVEYLYLSSSDDNMKPRAELEATLECLESMLADINLRIASISFLEPLPSDLIPERGSDVRLIAALYGVGILSMHKFGRDPAPYVLGFINFAIRLGIALHDDIVKRIWDIAVAALKGDTFSYFGISWNDVREYKTLSLNILITKFADHTVHRHGADATGLYYEHEGLLILDRETVISNMNLAAYTRTRTADLTDLSGLLRIRIKYDDKPRRDTFEELAATSRNFFSGLTGFRPSPERSLKDYSEGEELFVKVTAITADKITAESIDPDYRRVRSQLFLRSKVPWVPETEYLFKILKVGDVVRVRHHPGEFMKFNLGETLNDYYRYEAESLASHTLDCIYKGEYPSGSLWMSSLGFLLAVDNARLELSPEGSAEKIAEAKASGAPIQLTVYKKVNKANNIYANVNPEFKEPESFTMAEAKTRFYDDFLNWCYTECPLYDLERRNLRPFDPGVMLTPLANILCYIIEYSDMNGAEKYIYAVAARFMAGMCGLPLNADYAALNCDYQSRLLDFAANRPVSELHLPECFSGNARALEWEQTVLALSRYKAADIDNCPSAGMTVQQKVTRLVDAANNLRGTISLAEQNNIKLAIARTLNVDGDYVPLVSDRENFGIESQVLEFKQSIAFPPANRRRFAGVAPEPKIQKWAILKAVCGFMNSKFGGELLLGVNDRGFATGIESDFMPLYSAGMIKAPDMDNFTRYVIDELRGAFCEYDSDTSSSDICYRNVSYDPEPTRDGKHILRITVRPNPLRAVRFASGERPAGIEESYVRQNCETIALTPEMRKEVEDEKRGI